MTIPRPKRHTMGGVIYTVVGPEHSPEQSAAAMDALKRAYAFRRTADAIARELVKNLNRNVRDDVPTP